MAQYMCDYPDCGKLFASKAKLNQHKARVHGKAADDGSPAVSKPTGAGLKIKRPAGADTPAYHCGDCGTSIKKGQDVCPGCGEPLFWGDVSENGEV